jgi:hypothetical protein
MRGPVLERNANDFIVHISEEVDGSMDEEHGNGEE